MQTHSGVRLPTGQQVGCCGRDRRRDTSLGYPVRARHDHGDKPQQCPKGRPWVQLSRSAASGWRRRSTASCWRRRASSDAVRAS